MSVNTQNDISKWVDPHLPKNMYYGQYGWSLITSTSNSWFSASIIACGGRQMISSLIYHGHIVINGQTNVLKNELSEIAVSFYENPSLYNLQKKWRGYVVTR